MKWVNDAAAIKLVMSESLFYLFILPLDKTSFQGSQNDLAFQCIFCDF